MADPSDVCVARGVRFRPRPNTTDLQSIQEVVQRRVYTGREIPLTSGERWLDLGANVGAFSVFAASLGCEVDAYEPVRSNVQQLTINAALNPLSGKIRTYTAAVVELPTPEGWVLLATPRSERNQYRYTTMPKDRWETQKVSGISFAQAMERHAPHGIKMDIEGAEIAILESIREQPQLLDGVKYLALEYHLDYDPSLSSYHSRVSALREIFDVVKAPKLPEFGTFDKWPSGKVIRCWRV